MEQEEKAEKRQQKEEDPLKWLPLTETLESVFKCLTYLFFVIAMTLIPLVAAGTSELISPLVVVFLILFFVAIFYDTFRTSKKNQLLQWGLKLQALAANQPPPFLLCSNCGWQNARQANFCNRCGARL